VKLIDLALWAYNYTKIIVSRLMMVKWHF